MKRHLPPVFLLLSVILSFCAYFPGVSGYFTFDDTINIVDNPHLRISSLDWASLRHAAFSIDTGVQGRPISVLSFALNYYFNGLNPFYFKLTNVFIHLLNGIGVYLLTYLILQSCRQRNLTGIAEGFVRWMSVAVAAAWLVHPLNLTSVLYVVQRMTSLATLFSFLGLISYIYGRRLILLKRSGWGWIFAGFLIFTPLSFLCKENGALLPVFMLLTEVTFFAFEAKARSEKYLLMALFGVFVVLPATLLLMYTFYNPSWLMVGYNIRDFTLAERLMTEARLLWFYIRLAVAPDITQLGMYHDDFPLSVGLTQPVSTLWACAGIAVLVIGAMASIKRHPIAAFGILFFLVGHSIESTAIALELAHEHRNYLPVYGLLLALFYYLLYPLRHVQSLQLRGGVAILIVLLFAGITFVRAVQWGDPVEMKEKEVEHHPQSIRANIAVAAFYAAMPASSPVEANEFYRRAYEHYVKAAELSPSDTLGLFGLIALHATLALPIEESWIQALSGRVENYPFAPHTGNAIVRMERCVVNDACKLPPALVETLIQAALNNTSMYGKARIQVLFAWSDFLFRVKHRPDLAVPEAYRAADANMQDMDNQITLISMLINMGKLVEAQGRIAKARQFDEFATATVALDNLEDLITTLMSSDAGTARQ